MRVYNIRMDVVFEKDNNEKKTKFKDLKERFIKWITNFDSNFYFFLFLCVVGVVFFIDSLIQNDFTTLYGGDYASQQLSFYTNGYDDWWHFLTTGEFRFFDTNTYLGASNIGSNTFYYLFDPFFFPILLCPRANIAQGMAVLTIFKIATSGMFFMSYMKYMGASKNASRISALAFAFCGWMSWFLWFNHMTEICIVFPLMLWGVERVLRTKRPWLLMFSTMLMGLTNYFFLIGMGIAAFIYAMFRYFQRLKLNSTKDNLEILGLGFIGFLAGILLSGCVIFPAIITSLQAPRAANSDYLDLLKIALKNKDFAKLFSYIFEWKNIDFGGTASSYRHAYPLINFFFPCASCRGTPLMRYENEYYDNVATNIYCFVPMMLFFLPAFVRSMKEKKWSVIVAVVLFLVALETPFSYYLFFGFTAPYGRWELFFVAAFITYCGLHIDHLNEDPAWTKIASYALVIGMIIFAGAMAQHLIDTNDHFYQRSPYISATSATLIMCAYTTLVFVVFMVVKKEETRNTWTMCFIALEAAIMGFLTIEGHWCYSFKDCNNGLENNNDLYKLTQKIAKIDNSYYRCWSYLSNESARNDGMRNNYNGLGCFHSIYNFNLNNFLQWTRIQDGETFTGGGSWAGSYVWKNADIDKFLGVKYYFIQKNSPQWGWMGDNGSNYQYNVPLDFADVSQIFPSERFETFMDLKNLNFATAYNDLIAYSTKEDSVEANYEEFCYWNSIDVLRNDELLLEGALLEENIAQNLAETYPSLNFKTNLDSRNTSKQMLTSIKTATYDLTKSCDGQIYSVNTFFEDYAQRWLSTDEFKNVHALTSNQLVSIDNGQFEKTGSIDGENKLYGRYVTVVSPSTSNAFDSFYDENGYAVYVPYYYSETYAADIYLISQDNKIITWDRHQDDQYGIGGEKFRGFYVRGNSLEPAPKLGKIVVCQRQKKAIPSSYIGRIFVESYKDQQERLSSVYENAVSNVLYSANKIKFKTNYTDNKFVVTQMPYEKGWTIKAKTSDGKTKKFDAMYVDGGYTGFVSEVGETEYTMEFYPAYLKEGILISIAGAFIGGTTLLGYYLIQNKKKKEQEIPAQIAQ